jgi:hypothetical protein
VLDQSVRQGGLAVIDMGDDAEISNCIHSHTTFGDMFTTFARANKDRRAAGEHLISLENKLLYGSCSTPIIGESSLGWDWKRQHYSIIQGFALSDLGNRP